MEESKTRIVAFWREAGPAKWYAKDEAFDREIHDRFLSWHHRAARGELAEWERDAEGALALLLLLDQLPRNLFRGSAHAFATDPAAREVAARAIARGFDVEIGGELRQFFYLPFMHSEALEDQRRCLALCEAMGGQENVEYARIHLEIIERFGRFPHRNPVMGRETTPEERRFLDEGGFAG